ncbi:MAG: 2-dehydro-3-deoxy-D-gluconate 5-dehydrogenase KduD [Streptosporangiales bacterium]|nr:2-dehydro-3-deoxy-D-gluconate 5-dehydrogenase KduD [Streptosporangiales bacterium]
MGSPFDLHGRVALVTGGATGIGQAIAVGLAETGADLVLTSERDNLDETVGRVSALGRSADCRRLDLSRGDDIPEVVGDVLTSHRIDILVNAAGIIRRQPALEFSDENWREVLEVNLTAAFTLSRHVAAPMLVRGSGKIINIASMLSFQGGHLVTSYTASKHGLVGLTKAFANECAPRNVQVNALAPGYIATRTTEALRADPERSAEILARIPAGRWGTPRDISGAAVFLASHASDYVSGHVLAVDGGWMAR